MNDIVCCHKAPYVPSGHIVILDGNLNKTSADFLSCIGKQLGFPNAENCNWDAYLDWMKDLSWLNVKDISIIVLNPDVLLSEKPDKKLLFISDLKSVVFPFWRNDAENVFCDKNMLKEIGVYFVMKSFPKSEYSSFKEVVSIIRQTALNGQKTAHDTSRPVLRMEDGKLYLASFVNFYNKEQLKSAMIKRPSMWVLADLQTGEIVQRYLCAEKEFSESEYHKLYDVSSNELLSVDKQFWHNTYSLMDLIRNEYIKNKRINIRLYKEYLERVCKTIPKEYRVFYKDLNNINIKGI